MRWADGFSTFSDSRPAEFVKPETKNKGVKKLEVFA